MREIKFRAWNKIKKKMIYLFPNDTILFKNGKCTIWKENQYNKLEECCCCEVFTDVIAMQYTGIKNMDNGVEICEGDILRLPNGKKRTVLKVPGGFAIESLDCDYGKYGKRACVPIEGLSDEQNANFVAQCKVIGNIYENPELL